MRTLGRGRDATAPGEDQVRFGRVRRRLPSLNPSPRTLRRLLLGFTALVLAATWGAAGLAIHEVRERTYAEARTELLGAQYAMRAHTQRTLEGAQMLLTAIDARLHDLDPADDRREASFAELAEVIDNLRTLTPDPPDIRLFDGRARLLGRDGRPVAAGAGDREILDALQDAPSGTVHIGLPVRGRSGGQMVVPLALKARTNGLGIAVLAIEVGLDQFRRTYENLLIAAPATYGLLRSDSSILLLSPSPDGGPPLRNVNLDLARIRANLGPLNTVEHSSGGAEPSRRLSGFAFLKRYPVVTFASFRSADIDARWRGTAAAIASFAGFVTLVIALLSATALRLIARYASEADRVRVALAEAEAASSAKSSFMGRMSHEFRTPLNAILGFSEVIRDGFLGPLPPAYQQYGADIQRSGRHLLSLVDQILDIAEIEAGTAILNEAVVNLPAVIAEAVEAVGPVLATNRVDLRTDIDRPALTLVADRRMVQQAIFGILANAVKFSPADSTVDIALRQDGDGVHIRIADRGPGIPDSIREYLFEPFGRRPTYLADAQQGLGLGLLIARSFMESHGGSIAVEPHDAGGTVVILTFPTSRVVDSGG